MTELSDLATQELNAAAAAITADDPDIGRLAGEISRSVAIVNNESRKAIGAAERLHADDVMNPQGKTRLLAEIPANLMAATSEQLDQAELNLDVIEGIHLTAILRHDGRDDANRREELHNYVANLKQKDAVVTVVGLAANPRYATLLSGPMGDSLAARFGFKAEILRKTALAALAINGSEDQVRRSAALASIDKLRRVVGLARGGRDAAVEVVKRPPLPAPSTALMS